ncbi:hypothetical protein RBS60_11025 [Sinomonas sp. ASV486]|uniref:hypothetical protein n=1 Tax=Sinomonas sp. ASV486 TaxID=3051170 RepID=UPI0027DC9476|nr:hypothetical protein [Sinomonas sp. ASV486]MDQ4490730.1 hypothetical protein [Sinomonas sp. ASV486]
MKKKFIAAAGALCSLLVAGCGSTGQATPDSTPSVAVAGPASASATPTPTATEGPKSSRGNLIKAVGQPASLTYNDKTVATFVAKSIEITTACPAQYAPKPKNGQIVIVTFDAQTTSDLASTPMKTWDLNIFGWKAIAGNGTTVNGNIASFGCLDSTQQLPSSMGPAENATGKMAFDVPPGNGTLIYTEPGATKGWEWDYPAK